MVQFIFQAVLMLLIAALVIGFVVATSYALRRWRDGWRLVAGLPLLGVLAVVVTIVIDISADPTAHNLWPFEVLVAAGVASVALGAIQLMRFIAQRWAAAESR
jgi:hypothetical protein